MWPACLLPDLHPASIWVRDHLLPGGLLVRLAGGLDQSSCPRRSSRVWYLWPRSPCSVRIGSAGPCTFSVCCPRSLSWLLVMIPTPRYCSLFSSSERFKDLSKVTQPVRGRASAPVEPRVLTIHRTAVLPQDALGLPRALTEFLTSGSELTPPPGPYRWARNRDEETGV